MDNNKIQKFRDLVKENRDLIAAAGINLYTVRSYYYTDRLPSPENAVIISKALGVPLSDIPYTQMIRG